MRCSRRARRRHLSPLGRRQSGCVRVDGPAFVLLDAAFAHLSRREELDWSLVTLGGNATSDHLGDPIRAAGVGIPGQACLETVLVYHVGDRVMVSGDPYLLRAA